MSRPCDIGKGISQYLHSFLMIERLFRGAKLLMVFCSHLYKYQHIMFSCDNINLGPLCPIILPKNRVPLTLQILFGNCFSMFSDYIMFGHARL